MLLGGPTATTEDDKEDDNDGFKTVDDGEEAPDNPVVLKISMKEVTKPESSGLTGADRMFESEEEEDAEMQEQIAAALETVDPLAELKLSELSSDSESSSDDDDDNVDLNETKQYYQGQEAEGTGKSEMKSSNSKPATTVEPPAIPDDSGNPGGSGPDVPSEDIQSERPQQ